MVLLGFFAWFLKEISLILLTEVHCMFGKRPYVIGSDVWYQLGRCGPVSADHCNSKADTELHAGSGGRIPILSIHAVPGINLTLHECGSSLNYKIKYSLATKGAAKGELTMGSPSTTPEPSDEVLSMYYCARAWYSIQSTHTGSIVKRYSVWRSTDNQA